MRRTSRAVLSAVTFVAAFGLSGCVTDGGPAGPGQSRGHATTAPDVAPLPTPDTLSSIVQNLADRSIPVEQKVSLIQYGTVDDQPVLANFGDALAANGYAPLTVQATDLGWAAQPGDVTATVTLGAANPAVPPFVYPMEFSPLRDGWQLTRRSADQLLPLLPAAEPGPPR